MNNSILREVTIKDYTIIINNITYLVYTETKAIDTIPARKGLLISFSNPKDDYLFIEMEKEEAIQSIDEIRKMCK